MAKMQAAAQGGPVVDAAAMEEMRRLIFEAPIAELAESQGLSIDEAVQLRVEKNLEAVSYTHLDVYKRQPMGLPMRRRFIMPSGLWRMKTSTIPSGTISIPLCGTGQNESVSACGTFWGLTQTITPMKLSLIHISL